MELPFSEWLVDLPSCAAPCLTNALNFTRCAADDLVSTCLCKDNSYIETYRVCVRASCEIGDLLIAKNATWTYCNFPYQSQPGSVFGRVLIVGVTAIFFVVRQVAKFLGLSAWGADDWTLILGYQNAYLQRQLFTLSFAVSKFYGYELGIGRDVWSLSHDEINRFMRVFFAFEIIYTVSIGILKASILFFYLRVFNLVSPTFTIILWCTQVFNALNCIAFTIANLNQCKPFWYAWEGWDGRHPGYCVNLIAMLVSHAAINIAMDVWMLALPVTQVLWLNLRKRQKLEILSMFGLGVIITVISIIRLRVLLNFRSFQDPTYDAFWLHMWSYVELSTGVIVACLPSTRQLWRDLVPKLKKKIGLRPPSRPSEPGESVRRLKDILFLSGDQPSPTSGRAVADKLPEPYTYRKHPEHYHAGKWWITKDGSLGDPESPRIPLEAVSPILSTADSWWYDIDRFWEACRRVFFKPENSLVCGSHVHVSPAPSMQFSLLQLKMVAYGVVVYEPLVQQLLPYFRRDNSYCKDNTKHSDALIGIMSSSHCSECGLKEAQRQIMAAGTAQSVRDLMQRSASSRDDKHVMWNFNNTLPGRSGSIEFRGGRGLRDYTMSTRWIAFTVAFVHMCLSEPFCIRYHRPSLDDFWRSLRLAADYIGIKGHLPRDPSVMAEIERSEYSDDSSLLSSESDSEYSDTDTDSSDFYSSEYSLSSGYSY
ncbi:CFEM domain-containing protein [Colletotrichum karsti]|uniref:CFEM domain-containing protein n=1 Tax=Colletotrichum karsti TaxID=1095194 RepID=A0A9P6II99_9PEZI|nr:CFEM domain-containing protein [Colletotrichum karsti]KAF9881631.1 CFEM domain-containing protein [Colletotrichum karsti]